MQPQFRKLPHCGSRRLIVHTRMEPPRKQEFSNVSGVAIKVFVLLFFILFFQNSFAQKTPPYQIFHGKTPYTMGVVIPATKDTIYPAIYKKIEELKPGLFMLYTVDILKTRPLTNEEWMPCMSPNAAAVVESRKEIFIGDLTGKIHNKVPYNHLDDRFSRGWNSPIVYVPNPSKKKKEQKEHPQIPLYGLINEEGEEVLPPIYNAVRILDKGLILAFNADHSCIIAPHGKPRFSEEFNYLERVLINRQITGPVRIKGIDKSGKTWLLDTSFTKLTEKTYPIIGQYYWNRALVKAGNKTGFIDLNGKEIAPLSNRQFKNFHNCYAQFAENGKYGLIDTNGIEVLSPRYESVDVGFGGNFWTFREGSKTGIVTRSDKIVLEASYDSAEPRYFSRSSEIFGVRQIQKWALFDANQQAFLTDFVYDKIDFFQGNFTNADGYILDTLGNQMMEHGFSVRSKGLRHYAIGSFENAKIALADENLELLTEFIFDKIEVTSTPEVFKVGTEKGWGLINGKGEILKWNPVNE